MDIGWQPILISIGFIILLMALLVWNLDHSQTAWHPVRPKPVMTKAEIIFYERVVRAVTNIGGIDVFPQVAMGAVLEVKNSVEKNQRRAVRNRFDRKIMDFVIVDAETNVLLIIELDDSTHDSARDKARDRITESAGYPTMRIRGKAARSDEEIERQIRNYLAFRPS